MKTLTDLLKDWKSVEGQADPLIVLFDIEVDTGEVLRLSMGNPTGTGSITYDGNEYRAAAIELQEVEETIEGDLRDRQLAISNIDGIAAGFIELKNLEGRQVTITTVPRSSMAPEHAIVEIYTIQSQTYNRRVAAVTLGHSNLFKRVIPWRRFQRPRCQWDWERRFQFGNGCGFPGDEFGPDTAQNFRIGARVLEERQRQFGWFSLNTDNAIRADVDSPDVPDCLYVETSTISFSWDLVARAAPFFYKKLSGDFDVYSQVELFDALSGSIAGFGVQEEGSGQDSWVLAGLGLNEDGDRVARVSAAVDDIRLVTASPVVTVDTYFRLSRAGNVFTFSRANEVDVEDPTTGWTEVTQVTAPMDTEVRLGFILAASTTTIDTLAAGFRFLRFLAGGAPTCSRMIEGPDGCHEKGNVHRIFAFPGIPRR